MIQTLKSMQLMENEMNVEREMPKYECHKKVWALKIAGIVGDHNGGVYFQPADHRT